MTKDEFRDLYVECLFEASEKWPELYGFKWREQPSEVVTRKAQTMCEAIPRNACVMTGRQSAFALLARRLKIPHTVRAIQAAYAACTE